MSAFSFRNRIKLIKINLNKYYVFKKFQVKVIKLFFYHYEKNVTKRFFFKYTLSYIFVEYKHLFTFI